MARKLPSFSVGDRVALSAAFLKNTGQFTGASADKRGTFAGPALPGFPPSYGRVHWDDTPARIAAKSGQFAEADYCEVIARDGTHVPLANIAKVGSARFACNDL